MTDLFMNPDSQIADLVNDMANDLDDMASYVTCEKYLKKFNQLGYTFDYGLDAEPFNLRKLVSAKVIFKKQNCSIRL